MQLIQILLIFKRVLIYHILDIFKCFPQFVSEHFYFLQFLFKIYICNSKTYPFFIPFIKINIAQTPNPK
jgi:hypothetical protein